MVKRKKLIVIILPICDDPVASFLALVDSFIEEKSYFRKMETYFLLFDRSDIQIL